jgi:membrane protein implicated in regulation of membrane protease activity
MIERTPGGKHLAASFNEQEIDMIPLLLILLILALAFGGFFVFSLKVAVVVALVLLVLGLLGGRTFRGRRTAM